MVVLGFQLELGYSVQRVGNKHFVVVVVVFSGQCRICKKRE